MKFSKQFPYIFHDFQKENSIEVNEENDSVLFKICNLENDFFHSKFDTVLVVQCTQTFYRQQFIIGQNNQTVSVSKDLLGDKLEYYLVLISNSDQTLTINGKDDYYELGDCIGLVFKDSKILESSGSLGGLIKVSTSNANDIEYDLSCGWIQVNIPSEIYEKYIIWATDNHNTPIILSSLGLSCIQFALTQVKELDSLKDKVWWEIISVGLEKIGVDPDDYNTNDIPSIANKFLGNCIESMINTSAPEIDIADTGILA